MLGNKPAIAMVSGTLIKEVRQAKTPSGQLVTNATVQYKDDEGQTHRVPVKAWDQLAERLGALSLGDEVTLECSIEQERWTNKETHKRHSRLCLVAERFVAED